MKQSDKAVHALRWSTAVFVLLVVSSAHARLHKSEAWASSQFATAEHLHQKLEARPAHELTHADYENVIDAYRRVYFAAPTSTKADPSVVAVAQLLEEMGRRFEDPAILHSAIRQYEFLRRQYPGSKARFGALFRIGEIYKEDLHDQQHADEVFKEFLRRYPRNQFAEEARKALVEPVETPVVSASLKSKAANLKPDQAGESEPERDPDATGPRQPSAEEDSASFSGTANGRLTTVTGIRHWTTPGSVRVAIDLQRGVKYDAQRIDHPDRIFFDLFDTKLDPALVAKTFDVDDGLVKKVRISQFKPRQTRVVLEVGSAADFQASLLANPPRLVIDVRDKQAAKVEDNSKTPAMTEAESDAPEISTESRVATPLEAQEKAGDAAPESAPATELREERTAAKPAKNPAAENSSGGNITVLTREGIKKTIVDADDNDDAPKTAVAKLPAPDVKAASSPAAKPDTAAHARNTGHGKRKTEDTPDAREAQPTAAGDRSLIRALGLKIGKIVIDPGHGGHDTGTIGPGGLEEKDLVLDVSKRLGKLLESRLGAQVIYTRSDDTFIPLENRTAIANQEGADLFVSVHANSSRDPDARGVETYYLNFTTSSEALEVAARENAVSDQSIHELQDLVKKIALKEKIEESREFAVDVDRSLHSGLAAKSPGVRDRGVKKAPFIVLIGANMPSILAEISFLSNPGDERRLKTGDYRQKIAESLYRGIAKYVNGLSGVKVASKIEKTGTD
ncbi:MAG TPA: N-acetylmuramoyl-L-alanine amidase [Terriglobales bacterium]|nr:N-acetylmuramoyl-L-alanine amidase [Terriglobales bacterium]